MLNKKTELIYSTFLHIFVELFKSLFGRHLLLALCKVILVIGFKLSYLFKNTFLCLIQKWFSLLSLLMWLHGYIVFSRGNFSHDSFILKKFLKTYTSNMNHKINDVKTLNIFYLYTYCEFFLTSWIICKNVSVKLKWIFKI